MFGTRAFYTLLFGFVACHERKTDIFLTTQTLFFSRFFSVYPMTSFVSLTRYMALFQTVNERTEYVLFYIMSMPMSVLHTKIVRKRNISAKTCFILLFINQNLMWEFMALFKYLTISIRQEKLFFIFQKDYNNLDKLVLWKLLNC